MSLCKKGLWEKCGFFFFFYFAYICFFFPKVPTLSALFALSKTMIQPYLQIKAVGKKVIYFYFYKCLSIHHFDKSEMVNPVF